MKCKKCGGADLKAEIFKMGAVGIEEGDVRCLSCDSHYRIAKGILIFKIEDVAVLKEKSQWERFAESEGWLDPNEHYLEALPSGGANVLIPGDTIGWLNHEHNFFTMLKTLSLKGKLVLDLGAGRCWASKWMALMGAEVVAFDAMEHPTLGLGAGAIYLRNHGIHFDRVSGDFNELPFQDSLFDVVLSTGSMHHSSDLNRTLEEVSRVLKPGGILSIVNEPVSSFRLRDETLKTSGAQEGINEHEYRMTRYLATFKRHGLKLGRVFESPNAYQRGSHYYQGIWAALINRTRFGRIANLVLRGGVLNSVAEKQGSPAAKVRRKQTAEIKSESRSARGTESLVANG
jgi:ubiquinone/menaquinone biosynthesis C-methylase UbiE